MDALLDSLTYPIVQGPMLGASTRAMAIAASQAGALGSFAASGSNAAALKAEVAAIRAATERPFAVNLFILPPTAPVPATVASGMARLAAWRAELGLPEQAIPNKWAEDFDEQFAALVEAAPPAASFTFGILTLDQARALKARGTAVIGTATTVAEGLAWQDIGADAVVAQGFEAGGHRGTFLKPVADSLVGTLSLVATMVPALSIPVIAAGGISDGRTLAAALALGARAAQVGTAFLLTEESGISAPWRARLAEKPIDATRLTRAFSGRHARGIENRFMREIGADEAAIPPYPVQNALTQELRAAATRQGKSEYLSLWAGQSLPLIADGTTADVLTRLWAEARTASENLQQRMAEIARSDR